MLRNTKLWKSLTILLVLTLAATAFGPVALANNFSVSFKNSNIEITSPSVNGASFDGRLTITGKSTLPTVFFALRGPAGEMVMHPATVTNGTFSTDIFLRFGEGKYTVWAGANSKSFDGSIRFEVSNKNGAKTVYLTESAFVDSENELIKKKLAEITNEKMTDMEKLKAIHTWVSSNVKYDYELYKSGANVLVPASKTLTTLTGICRDYSFLFAAMARAAGIETKVVYGDASTTAWGTALHAWNESFVDGKWISIDTTWDAGFIRNNAFVSSPTSKYFNPEASVFAATHKPTIYTTH